MKQHDLQPAPGSHQRPDPLWPRHLGRPRQDRRPRHQGPEFSLRRRPSARTSKVVSCRWCGVCLTWRGFTNLWRIEYAPVNVERLNVFPAGAEVDP